MLGYYPVNSSYNRGGAVAKAYRYDDDRKVRIESEALNGKGKRVFQVSLEEGEKFPLNIKVEGKWFSLSREDRHNGQVQYVEA